MHRSFSPATISILLGFSLGAHTAEITVNNDPFHEVESPMVAELTAIRPLSNFNPEHAGSLDKLYITRDLLLQAVKQFPNLQENLRRIAKDPNDVQLNEIYAAVSYPTEIESMDDARSLPLRLIRSPHRSEVSDLWDATTLINLAASGAIDFDNQELININDTNVAAVRFNPEFGEAISDTYFDLTVLNHAPLWDQHAMFVSLKEDVKKYDQLEQALLQDIGDISFGYPVVYGAEEKNLEVPESLLSRFDVYWMDLAVTFRERTSLDLVEMTINFALPAQSVALELVPLRYGEKVEAKVEGGMPEVGVEFRGAKITVGEFFQSTIQYTYLRPTVTAFGLRERRFSWELRNEAVSAGSHRFVAVVGVPKGIDSVDLAMSGHVQLKASWLGEWYDGELMAGTEVVVVPIAF